MVTTRVFRSGNSQAVRIPKEFAVTVDELEIERNGDELILRPPARNLAEALDRLPLMPDDFMSEGRNDEPPQERDWFS